MGRVAGYVGCLLGLVLGASASVSASALPPCSDADAQTLALQISVDLIADILPPNVAQPFQLEQIVLEGVVSLGANADGSGRACVGRLVAPWVGRPTRRYDIGAVGFAIVAAPTPAHLFAVYAQLGELNFHRGY